MKFPNPFDPKYWVMPEPSNVIHLNTSHARANAAQAAMLLEADREAVRQDELRNDLMRRRRENIEERERIESAIDELDRQRVMRTRT